MSAPSNPNISTIVSLRVNDRLSLRAIGAKVGLSGERVRNILHDQGIDLSARARGRAPAQHNPNYRKLNAKQIQQLYGCSVDELCVIQGGRALSNVKTPAFHFRGHRNRTVGAGQKWAFTLPDWWSVWQVQWASRHRKNLLMVPVDPSRPIGLGNAEIITKSESMKRWWASRDIA